MKFFLTIIFVIFLLNSCTTDPDTGNLVISGNTMEDKLKLDPSALEKMKNNKGKIMRRGESSPYGYEPTLPPNSPPIVSDYFSRMGANGGKRSMSIYAGGKFAGRHGGVDFYIKRGTPILAPADGTVYGVDIVTKYDGTNQTCVGSQLAISHHDSGLFTAYLHIGEILVQRMDKVKRGQVIAYAGELVPTMCGGGIEHLHFHVSNSIYLSGGWGTIKYMGVWDNWVNPHDYWTGGKGIAECYEDDKIYPKELFTLPVKCF
tara:strand:+ start:1573 stop:2352 length:780 start_codon:yes stop_codon:yes gene_type:complete